MSVPTARQPEVIGPLGESTRRVILDVFRRWTGTSTIPMSDRISIADEIIARVGWPAHLPEER